MPTLIEGFYILVVTIITVRLIKTFIVTKQELNQYRLNDLSAQEGWTNQKTNLLIDGAERGFDLEHLSEQLHQSQASVRAKLVSLKLYDQYLERQVIVGEVKLEEWKALKKKIGKVQPMRDGGAPTHVENLFPSDWKFVQSLSQNWFDPRLEFCETFQTSPLSKLPDPRIQHEVIKHVAAFLNSAGGEVLVGFGRQGKLIGLLDDDLRTQHHYKHRIEEALRKALGLRAQPFFTVTMIRWGSEDVCLISCQRADCEIVCVHQRYNVFVGQGKHQKIVYSRINAQSVALTV